VPVVEASCFVNDVTHVINGRDDAIPFDEGSYLYLGPMALGSEMEGPCAFPKKVPPISLYFFLSEISFKPPVDPD
jgi:hypothetical protein